MARSDPYDRDADIRNAEDGRPPRPESGPILWGPEEPILPPGAYTTGYAEGGEPETTQARSALDEGYHRVDKALTTLGQGISGLEQRLGQVLVPERGKVELAQMGEKTPKDKAPRSLALRRLNDLEEHVTAIQVQVMSLMTQVDI